jgi:hypothetical protein
MFLKYDYWVAVNSMTTVYSNVLKVKGAHQTNKNESMDFVHTFCSP